MNKPCPADVILQFVIDQIHEGHFDRVLALGFSWEQIRFLESLSGRDLHYVSRFAEHFIALRIDIDPLQSHIAIERVIAQQRLRETQQALLRAGAPRQLMNELYGWTATDYCEQRKFLGLADDLPKGGRPRAATPEDEDRILLDWDQRADQPLAERYLATAQSTGATIRQVRTALARRAREDEEARTALDLAHPAACRAREDQAPPAPRPSHQASALVSRPRAAAAP